MLKLNFRVLIFLAALIFGVVFSAPTLLNSDFGKKITLGLDLQGGLHMVLGVKSEVAVESKIKSTAAALTYSLDKDEIIYEKPIITPNGVSVEILDEADVAKFKELIKKDFIGTTLVQNGLKFTISLTPEEIIKIKKNSVDQAIETIRGRLDLFGLSEPTVAKQGEDKILVEVAGIKTAADEQRIRELIAKSAKLEMMAVDEEAAARVDSMSKAEAEGRGDVILSDISTPQKYLLKAIPVLDGSMLTDATVGYSDSNQPTIDFKLNSQGAKIFGDFSGRSVGKRMAIVLDGKVYSAPVINERIGGGSGQISGNFTPQEAHDVAIALRSGALLAPVVIEEKRSVGPSLGADSVKSSLMALVFGFVAVVLFMVIYYGLAGVIANIAIVVNIFLIIAIMSLFGATLTLPGMAGIVLTIGMAVDANVIITERMRELLREGKSISKAIEDGYNNAFVAIWDANITTLIAAVALYVYGTGPIKGFALTISIGILSSMLTAILGTHGIYNAIAGKIKKDKYALWFGLKDRV